MSTVKGPELVDDVDYSWEVKANDRDFHETKKKKWFLCFKRNNYKNNRIKTSKYNVLTFIPLNLFEQYHKAHVVFFTCLLVLQSIPYISTYPWFIIVLPLMCIILVRALRDLIDDIARHRSDTLINNKPCKILTEQRLPLCLCPGSTSKMAPGLQDISFQGNPWALHLGFVIGGREALFPVQDGARHEGAVCSPCGPLQFTAAAPVCFSTRQGLQIKKWKNILVGNIVCLQKDDFVPADMLLLYSSEPESLCYVETAGIDGETNLKFRQSLAATHIALHTEQALAEFDGLVTCEAPNVRMHKFVGTLDWKGTKYPLNNENILLRGCRIRNTQFCYGLVIYAGFDTKIMKNSGKMRLKKTKLDSLISKLVLCIAVLVISISFFLAIGAGVWDTLYLKKHNYLPDHPQMSSATYGFVLFWSYVISMSTLVPFLLYITLDLIHIMHNFFINHDLEMYYEDTDTPAQARGTSLNDLLGQIEYVFTDKTGTLTQNVMTFKKCCIGQRTFGMSSNAEKDHQKVSFDWNTYADSRFQFCDHSLIEEVRKDEDPIIREFFRMIALCHTVMVDQKPGDLIYQAASPDEEALVTAARNFGYVFLSRTQETITISELGTPKTFSILALLDFSSVRKRMSILVREPEGKIKLYTKGADSIILERLHASCQPDGLIDALDGFAQETLRTLCLAYKDVEESEYEQWSLKHQKAAVSLQNREELMEIVYEKIETDLQLLGATAIEDKLQDGVPETIQLLKDGNIKVWMLTGDKQETAVNIAYSCNLLSSDMKLMDESEIRCFLDSSGDPIRNKEGQQSTNREPGTQFPDAEESWEKTALVITGDSLNRLMDSYSQQEPDLSLWKKLCFAVRRNDKTDQNINQNGKALVELACRCQSVICCRVTPKQKASIVELVKTNKKAITLAIGDGGNDVNMIRTAHVGVGINGKEGLQAVLVSDFSFAQFAFLQRLLFVHGRWSYMRFSKFLRYYNYKTFASLMHNIWYAFFNCFTALQIYDSWFLVFNAILYTLYPTFCMSMLDKDMDSSSSLQHPELYVIGQKDRFLGIKILIHVIYGTYTSLVMFFIPYAAFLDTAGPGGIFDYQVLVITMTTIGILAVLAEAVMEISFWPILAFLALILSLILYFLISYVTETPSAYFYNKSDFNFLDAMVVTLRSGYIWLVILLGVIVSIMPSMFCRSWYRLTTPSLVQSSPPKQLELHPAFKRDSLKRRSSYAFSHSEGYGNLISRGTSLRKIETKLKEEVLQE